MEEEESVSFSSGLGGGIHFTEATEYVRQQLSSMGVESVTETELEAYTQGSLCLIIDSIFIMQENSLIAI